MIFSKWDLFGGPFLLQLSDKNTPYNEIDFRERSENE